MNDELDKMFDSIKDKYNSLSNNCDKDSLKVNLNSLAHWNDEPMDYENNGDISWPEKVDIAYAVCHPNCGCKEFIVEGSTQRCQHCGGLMYRCETKEYRLS